MKGLQIEYRIFNLQDRSAGRLLVLPSFELSAQSLTIAIGPAVLIGDRVAPTLLQIRCRRAAYDGGASLGPYLLVGVETREQLFVETSPGQLSCGYPTNDVHGGIGLVSVNEHRSSDDDLCPACS